MAPPSQAHRFLQAGMSLLVFSSLDGFAIPHLASPRIALSVHTLSAFQAVLLLVQGSFWMQLKLSPGQSSTAFWCALYSTFAILGAYLVAAFWGVGNETIQLMGELPHGLARGTVLQETFIKILAYSSAPTGLTWFVLVIWGLRNQPAS